MTPRQSDRLNELLDGFWKATALAVLGPTDARWANAGDHRDAILAFVDAELKAAKRSAKRTETT